MEEHIKSGKKSRVLTLIGEMWPAYLIEVLVIILGITITLALEEWRDVSREERLASIYNKNLQTDIATDLQTLQYTTGNTRALIDRGNELLAFADDPEKAPLSPGRLDTNLQMVLGRPDFISSDPTFSDLKSSGNLHLIKDIRLKNLLFAYYSLVQNIREVQDAERQATIVISAPYFLHAFPLGTGAGAGMPPRQLAALAKDIGFRNNVLLRVSNRKELLEDYERATTLAGQVRDALRAGE